MPRRDPVILRLARTLPRDDQPGVGLHCFYYSQLIERPTVIVAKHDESPSRTFAGHIAVHEVRYSDRAIGSENPGLMELVLVGLSKVYGAIRLTSGAIAALRERRTRPSVIHIHSANYLLCGIALKLIYGSPLCLNFGGTELLRARRIPLYRWMFRFVDTGFYVARAMEPDLHRVLPPDRCVYTANGIDHSLFYVAQDAKRGTDIVAVGNLRWQKDYETLIRAFAAIAPRFPEMRLSIYGEGELRGELEELRHQLDLDGKVALQGTQPQEVLRAALQTCRLYVISSKREGFPKALIEAMACGAPAIATNAGECASVLEGIVDAVPVSDSTALAEAMTYWLGDERKLAALSSQCARRSKDFGWDRVCEVVDRRYREMLAHQHNRR